MVTINPADCKPGEVYEGTVHGVERTVLIRRDASDSYPWESLGEVLDHEDVSDLVRLVPAREVTRQDLPTVDDAAETYMTKGAFSVQEGIALVIDAVVAHLNANGGLPADDRWRRAHAIVEQERDQARERVLDLAAEVNDAKADRDQARRERDEEKEGRTLFQRDAHKWRERAEAAEARTAPAVTREDVEKAIRQGWGRDPDGFGSPHGVLDAVCALFGVEAEPADPVVYAIRESDLPHMEDDYLRNFDLGDGRAKFRNATDEEIGEAREVAESDLRWLIAVQQHIEADQPDPVEAKARELYGAANAGTPWGAVVQSANEGNRVDREVVREYRAIAAHVLGQETGRG